jgi:hypothetical protein
VTEDASTHRQQFAGRLLAVNCPAVVSYENADPGPDVLSGAPSLFPSRSNPPATLNETVEAAASFWADDALLIQSQAIWQRLGFRRTPGPAALW